ncbi:MAG: PDDEXK nuclease domain-containing protein [Candidatus Delongbacteria bacterium]|nr:PDDEXK nuclease domain-containing protein [Candidatus Delongbacteria bacterium]
MKEEIYIKTIKQIKSDILQSRFLVSKIANKELLFLYFKVGSIISDKVTKEKWGSKTIENLSADLQKELKGLRGFSFTNLKRMRQFYDHWIPYLISQPSIKDSISPLTTGQIGVPVNIISPLITGQFVELFTILTFTAHCEIMSKAKSIEAKVFYISKAATEFWNIDNIKRNIKSRLFEKQGKLPNNFGVTLPEKSREKALAAFRDQYLLDFVRISDEDEDDEKVLENEIVRNIKKFLMSLGNDFAFIGNQYRLIVEDEEYFIDILFYNRKLQALIAFELKSGKFKPEYLGKMNFYLSALDEYVKLEHENPSIGIILCKEKKNKIVEFSFRNFDRAMGVATYSTSTKLPAKYKNILPDEKTLKKLMD